MNFYKHYIGDFQRDTSHLSLTERGAYLALIHHYYATEKPLPNNVDALCRIAGAQTKVERDAVKSVLSYFEVMESGLINARIEAELDKHDDRADKNREIALQREAKRREQREHDSCSKRGESVNDSYTNAQPTRTRPITTNQNHTPIVPKGTTDRFQEFWDIWPNTERKADKKKCLAKWKSKNFDSIADKIFAHIATQKNTQKWQTGYEPAPMTYLNGERWNDGVGPVGNPWDGAK